MQLLYVMDPMCAWCYGFAPELEKFLSNHSLARIKWVMGGLAPDTHQPMPDQLKQTIASYWHQIELATQVTFNHDYWKLNTPYRSTYPACRAVITAKSLMEHGAHKMVAAIQQAYYVEAKNPSMEETLIGCAISIGLDKDLFVEVLRSDQTEQELQKNIRTARQLNVSGFPALFYVDETSSFHLLTAGYCDSENLELRLNQI